MIRKGVHAPLGANADDGGVNFAVHSPDADRVEVCLFDADDREIEKHDLPERDGDVWHGYLPGCQTGQSYGYRAHGRYAPDDGMRFNPAKVLLDPYARELSGRFCWSPEVFDFVVDGDRLRINESDNAAFVPKSIVVDDNTEPKTPRPHIPWADMIVYETNVRGYTMRHPAVPDAERGKFAGMRNGEILDYLKALGITSIELMPVFEFIDEHFLHERGLRNFWGYNSINFFTPARRYSQGNARVEFREMVDAIHEAGFEVIMDVAYNHTGESDKTGPTISFRGLDNLGYYRTEPDDRGKYVNDTGTGNTINMDQAHVRELILDSLRYWTRQMGVDGFRFDLATVLGRRAEGFTNEHPFFKTVAADEILRNVKLIAEPWDTGPGGYQLGRFPPEWAEWNDRYRDSVRRFWRGDAGEAAEFARRLHGSSDVFESNGRGPCSSVNFVTAHDGFTLTDVVSYEQRKNDANGESNNDGHSHNYSHNYGIEGATDDADVNALRRQQRLNMLATLLLSQGTPMLLAGDEIGNSQQGNNNVYAQDNEVGWVDWSGLEHDPEFLEAIRALIDLRHEITLFRQPSYLHGAAVNDVGWGDIQWLKPDGQPIGAADWADISAMSVVLTHVAEPSSNTAPSVVLLINASTDSVRFTLPRSDQGEWKIRFVSAAHGFRPIHDRRWQLPARSLVCVSLGSD